MQRVLVLFFVFFFVLSVFGGPSCDVKLSLEAKDALEVFSFFFFVFLDVYCLDSCLGVFGYC